MQDAPLEGTTVAERIAELFDGADCKPLRGRSRRYLADICERFAVRRDTDGSRRWDTPYRWMFRDGSTITAAGSGYDLGYPDCFCWAGAGHMDDCTQEEPCPESK